MKYALSPHFTSNELIASRTAQARGIDNVPPVEALALAEDMCNIILEPVRARFGPVVITSGYRCPELNKAVGGAQSSQHVWTATQVAVDFKTPQAKLQEVFDWLRLESKLPFDQLILERGKVPDSEEDDCIHLSYVREPRRMALAGETHNRSGYTPMAVA